MGIAMISGTLIDLYKLWSECVYTVDFSLI